MSRRRRQQNDSGVSGCVIIDKPAGCTSHDVVDQVRRQLGTRKVGHAGTLDPDATGVLVFGVGIGTKLLQFVTGSDKSYIGQLQFGIETSTLDAAGEVTARHDMAVTPAEVALAILADVVRERRRGLAATAARDGEAAGVTTEVVAPLAAGCCGSDPKDH